MFDSSIWLEDNATRIVWITLLPVMNGNRSCRFADSANVARASSAAGGTALKRFEGPDPLTPEDENQVRHIKP